MWIFHASTRTITIFCLAQNIPPHSNKENSAKSHTSLIEPGSLIKSISTERCSFSSSFLLFLVYVCTMENFEFQETVNAHFFLTCCCARREGKKAQQFRILRIENVFFTSLVISLLYTSLGVQKKHIFYYYYHHYSKE